MDLYLTWVINKYDIYYRINECYQYSGKIFGASILPSIHSALILNYIFNFSHFPNNYSWLIKKRILMKKFSCRCKSLSASTSNNIPLYLENHTLKTKSHVTSISSKGNSWSSCEEIPTSRRVATHGVGHRIRAGTKLARISAGKR